MTVSLSIACEQTVTEKQQQPQPSVCYLSEMIHAFAANAE